jgi:dTDP-4-dehydrorhamnose 3,5-epimerase
MIFTRTDLAVDGCYELVPRKMEDDRGLFVKTFHRDAFAEQGLETEWQEEYYSVSRKGVLRGLHFQLPPHDHVKLVYCPSGTVLDAVLDLRIGSPTYGCHAMVELSARKANMVYIPKGVAHGFYTLSDEAIMIYNVSSVYAPHADVGLLWNSAEIPWPDREPLLSPRDRAFPRFSDFTSNPFRY